MDRIRDKRMVGGMKVEDISMYVHEGRLTCYEHVMGRGMVR